MANTKIPSELSSTPSISDNGDATAITINSSEQVGIGVSPDTALHVKATGIGSNGTIKIEGENAHLGYSDSTDTFKSWVGHFNASQHGSDGDFNIKTGYDTTGNIRITADGDNTDAQVFLQGSTGRLSIGNTNPSAELHVSGDAIANTFKLIANTSVSGSDATIFRPADNTMAFSTNGTERMRISNAGLITTPNRPAFMLGTPSTSTAGNVWKSSTIWYNNGNHWNNTTGRFTAPVAGYYMFYHWGMLAHGQTTTDADNYTRKNGSRDQIGTAYCGAQGGHYLQFAATVVRYLAANDYVDLYIHSGTIYNAYGDRHGSFGGFLLG